MKHFRLQRFYQLPLTIIISMALMEGAVRLTLPEQTNESNAEQSNNVAQQTKHQAKSKSTANTQNNDTQCKKTNCGYVAVFQHPQQGRICMRDYSDKPFSLGPPETFDLYNNNQAFQYKPAFRLPQQQCQQIATQTSLPKRKFFAAASKILLANHETVAVQWYAIKEINS